MADHPPEQPRIRPPGASEEKPDSGAVVVARGCVPCVRSSQTEMTGTNMLESRYEVIIEKPTARASGTNMLRAAPSMKNDRQEHGQDAQHRQQARHRRLAVAAPDRQGHGIGVLHLRVDVLDLDRRLIDQDADRQRQAAERHQVDRLPGRPQGHHGPHQGQRDVEHDHDHAPPVAQEQQHHQARQHRAEQPLGADAPHGPGDVGRLVELEADVDVRRQRLLHPRQVLLDRVDHRQRGGVGPLGHHQVDGALAVDQGVAGRDVRRVRDGARSRR